MPLQDNVKVYGNADIVWVLDVSGTMADITQGVKDNIAQFVGDLTSSGQSPVKSLRLGLVTHDVEGNATVRASNFAETTEEFVSNLMNSPEGANEYGLPAVDRALDFNWRSEARRYIIFITDEPVAGGTDPAGQTAKLPELSQKMAGLHVHFLGFGPACESYEQLGLTPGSDYTDCIPGPDDHGALVGLGFQTVLKGLAQTITAAGNVEDMQANVPKNLYGL